MKIATCFSVASLRLGSTLGRLLHGALLLIGMTTVAFHGASLIQGGSLEFGRAAVGAASAAELHAPQFEEPVPTQVATKPTELSPEMERVKRFVSKRKVSRVALRPILATAESTGQKLGLDPLLLVAMIAVESSFNPFAESGAGAQGLMQVIPRFHMDKIGENADEDALFDPRTNIRVGAMVLRKACSAPARCRLRSSTTAGPAMTVRRATPGRCCRCSLALRSPRAAAPTPERGLRG